MAKESHSQKPSRKVRWILYPMVGLVFALLLASLLVLANGYLPEIHNGKVTFKKTGMIILSVRPLDANISINGKFKEKSSFYLLPNKLNNLLPGSYTIRVEKKGFRTWEKTIRVEPGLVTWANYVIMFAEKLDLRPIAELSGLPISVSDDNRHLLYATTKDGKYTVTSYETSNLSSREFWPKDTSTLPAWLSAPQVVEAKYSQNGERILFTIKNGDSNEYVLADPINNDIRLTALSSQWKVAPALVSWDPYDNDAFFVVVDSTLYHLKSGSTELTNPVVTNIISYKFEANRQLYYAKRSPEGNVSIERSGLDGNNKVTILDSIAPSSAYQFAHTSESDALAIRSIDTGDLLLVYPANGDNNIVLRLGKGYKNTLWHRSNKMLLYYSDSTLYRYDIERKLETHFQYSGKVISADWYHDDSHFLVSGDNGLTIMEFDGGNPLVLSFTQPSVVSLNRDSNGLIYADKVNDQIVYTRFASPY